MKSFFEKCVDGEAQPDQIDQYIEDWHYDRLEDKTLSLKKFLGIDDIEYNMFLVHPKTFDVYLKLKIQKVRDENQQQT